MSAQAETELSGLGVPGRQALLVHQRHLLQGRGPAELEEKNGNLPEVRGAEVPPLGAHIQSSGSSPGKE